MIYSRCDGAALEIAPRAERLFATVEYAGGRATQRAGGPLLERRGGADYLVTEADPLRDGPLAFLVDHA